MFRISTVIACVFVLVALMGFVEAQTVIEVNESSPNWAIGAEAGTPTYQFAAGPGTPPYGAGSVQMQLAGPGDGALLATDLHNGLRLADITILSYATYQDVTPQAIALQFNPDYDDTDGDTSTWQGRLVYEPSYTHTVLADTWQTWNPLDNAGNGNWWSSGTPVVGGVSVSAVCTQGNPCTWAEVLAAYPNVAIHSNVGALLVKAGSGWPAFDGAADAIRVATAATDVLYNLETEVPVELMSFSVE